MVGSEIDNPELIKLCEELVALVCLLIGSVLVHFGKKRDYS